MTLNDWRIEQGFTFDQLAKKLGEVGTEATRRYCLPPDDPLSRVPKRPVMARIWLLSRGAVAPNSFYSLPKLPRARAA